MATKSTTTTTLTTKEVEKALSKSKGVTAEEEKALRMRHGVKAPLSTPLARKAPEDSDAGSELLLMEMNLLKTYRAHLAQKNGKAAKPATKAIAKTAPVAAPAAAKPAPSAAKSKIVSALRKKK